MDDNKNLISSPKLSKLSSSANKISTPCRRVGLKRKSTGTPILTNVLKKTNAISESKKCIKFDDNSITINTVAKDKSITQLNYKNDSIKKNIEVKQREIEELKSELKNSEMHNLDQIQKLSKKWLEVCQEALLSLLNQLNQNSNQYTMEDLIKNIGIDPDLIHFDSNNQEFY